MSVKQIITYLIIIIAVVIGVFFAYKALFSGPAAEVASTTKKPAGTSILPMGTRLDFEKVKKFNESGRTFQYPAVTPIEVGPSMGAMIKQ